MTRIALVFPELLGTYGDGGNAIVLAQRLRWRGLPADIVRVGVEDPLPRDCDLYVLGGGEDAPQTFATARLVELARGRPAQSALTPPVALVALDLATAVRA